MAVESAKKMKQGYDEATRLLKGRTYLSIPELEILKATISYNTGLPNPRVEEIIKNMMKMRVIVIGKSIENELPIESIKIDMVADEILSAKPKA